MQKGKHTTGTHRIHEGVTRLAAMLLVIVCLAMLPGKADARGFNPYSFGQCTYYVYERASAFGYVPPINSDAVGWYDLAPTVGLSVGSEPQPNSIVVFDATYNGTVEGMWGHVAWVESVQGSDIVISEMDGATADGQIIYRTIPGEVDPIARMHGGNGGLIGYIYVTGFEEQPVLAPMTEIESLPEVAKAPSFVAGTVLDAPPTDVAAGDYVIYSALDGYVLDVDATRIGEDGANAQVWSPLGNSSQIFHVEIDEDGHGYTITCKQSGKCLDAEGGAEAMVANIVQCDDCNGKNQHWLLQDAGGGYCYVYNLNGYYLDVENGSAATRNGGNVRAYLANGSPAQRWKFVPVSGGVSTRVSDGTYALRSAVASKTLDIVDASSDNNANARVWSPYDSTSQLFTIGWNDRVSANSIQLAWQSGDPSFRWLDSEGGNQAGNVSQYERNDGYNQNWLFEDAGDGWYYIRNLWGYYLDLADAKAEDGTNACTANFTGSDTQRWKPMLVSGAPATMIAEGNYVLTSKLAELALDVAGASTMSGTNVRVREAQPLGSQIFAVDYDETHRFNTMHLLSSANDGLFVDASDTDGVANVVQLSEGTGGSQSWFFEDAGDGWYYVRNLYGYYLEVEDAAKPDNVRVAGFTGSDAQRWRLDKPSLKAAKIAEIPTQTLTSSPVTPDVTVTLIDTVLVEGVNYTVSYEDNEAVGSATVTVKGKGLYKGKVKATFEIEKADGNVEEMADDVDGGATEGDDGTEKDKFPKASGTSAASEGEQTIEATKAR